MRAAVPAPVAPAAAGWFPPRRSSAALRACFGEASASKRGLLVRVRPGSGPGPRPALVALVLLSTVFLFAAVLRPAPSDPGALVTDATAVDGFHVFVILGTDRVLG